jgi:hypothetical protein
MITKGNDGSCERNMVPHNDRDNKFRALTACEENQIVSLLLYISSDSRPTITIRFSEQKIAGTL